jgi:phosphoribosylformylglycinamidine synthase
MGIKRPKALILKASGTNCDLETKNAFDIVGFCSEIVHINEFISRKKSILDYDAIAIPGGFSYGDDISAGKIFAIRIKSLKEDFRKFIEDRRPLIGICNGFQVLVKTGFLPKDPSYRQRATLYLNDCGHFVCKWVKMRINKKSKCIWTQKIDCDFYLPVAHGEGKFIAPKNILDYISKNNMDAIKYIENPNGSINDIAGITNEYGNVLGLMPHPERAFFGILKPGFYDKKYYIGYEFFRNARDYLRF